MKSRLQRVGLGLAALAVLAGIFAYSLWNRRTLYTTTWFDLFDTVSVVKGYARSQAEWDEQMDALHADLLHYHQLFDIYHHYDGMVNLCDGAVKIAAGAVLSLWHDARESDTPAPPADALIQDALTHCNAADLQLDPNAHTVFFADPDLQLDVGAVAKGYSVELAASAAEARGLDSALLNIGGNLRAIGEKANGEGAWTVGVENPWNDDPAYIQTLALPDGYNLIVSGDYQRYFEYEGVRYSHLIDLTTGYPAQYVSSVAVLTTDQGGGIGDAFSTALFCLPAADGRRLLETQPGLEAMWMYPDGTTTQTNGWPGQPTE